jgi:hypothetical protein
MISSTRLSHRLSHRLPPVELFHRQVTQLSAYRQSAPSYSRSCSWTTTLASSPSPLAAADWEKLSEVERVRRSMRLPIEKTLPSLESDELLRSVFVKGLGLGGSSVCTREEMMFQQAYHRERLEWLGDRLHNAIVAEVLFVLGPVKRGDGGSRLSWIQTRCALYHLGQPQY